MAAQALKQQSPQISQAVIEWLLDSDPAIRWQVMRDLTGASADAVAAKRAKVATEGWGARLLALQGDDGKWSGGWDATMHALMLLRDFGLDPAGAAAHRAVGLVRERVVWEGWGTIFFGGESEPCVNGQVGAVGAYFGQEIERIVGLLLTEQLSDGGWNCEAQNGSTRSSFNTTICVLEALLEYGLAGANRPEITEARLRGQEYLLERQLMRRKSTGEVIAVDRKKGDSWLRFAYPTWWHYDVLRGLEYFRHVGGKPDARLSDAIELVESKRQPDGRWLLDVRYPGEMPVEVNEGVGQPSRWITLRALRVLKWYGGGA